MGVAGSKAARSYLPPVPLTAEHRIEDFGCGKPNLSDWLKAHALNDEGRASRTCVVVANSGPTAGVVVGYYTLATGGVAISEVPRKLRHNLPKPVPVMLLGRLAVDPRHHRKGDRPSQSAGVRAIMVHAMMMSPST